MEKLTEFVSKSFDPSKSALSVQYLAQSAAKPDNIRSETPGGGNESSDSSGPHDLRMAVPHLSLGGLPLDLPRYPLLPVTSSGLPYPLPLLLGPRGASAAVANQHSLSTNSPLLPSLSPPLLLQRPSSMRPQSPSSPRQSPSPKRRRRLSSSTDGMESPGRHVEEEEEVDVEGADEPANLSLANPSSVPSSTTLASSDDRRNTTPSDNGQRVEVKNEPAEITPIINLDNNKKDALNNNDNNSNNKNRNDNNNKANNKYFINENNCHSNPQSPGNDCTPPINSDSISSLYKINPNSSPSRLPQG